MIIYKITNIKTKDFYIGQTISNIDYRFRKHKELSNRGGGYKLHNAMRKYGTENFIIDALDTATTLDELNEKEIFYIKSLGPSYNILEGGHIRLNQVSIEKMRKSLMGKKHSKELIDKRFRKLRQLEKDKNFLKERGKLISESKKKNYVVNGEYFSGIDAVSLKYNIKYATARYRILSDSKKWQSWTKI